jgi:uncharacterized protein
MLFVVECRDKPGHLEVRLSNRPAHLAYLEANHDRIRMAGPLLAEDGATPIGSLLIVEAADRAAIEAFCAGDPYAHAGLFAEVRQTPWRQVLPKT